MDSEHNNNKYPLGGGKDSRRSKSEFPHSKLLRVGMVVHSTREQKRISGNGGYAGDASPKV